MRSIIIAEAGVNHNGSLSLAKRLIDLQKLGQEVSNYIQKQLIRLNIKRSAGEKNAIRKIRIVLKIIKLISYCNKNIRFLSTAFDLDGLLIRK